MSKAQQRMPSQTLQELREKLSPLFRQDENTCVSNLLTQAPMETTAKRNAQARARALVETVRANRKRFGGLDSFLQEFGLSTKEGIALMCLAEALLRIPDADTANKLIRDKIGSAEWDKHLGHGSDLFVNASTWALMLTGKVIGDFPDENDEGFKPSALAGRMVSKLGEPVVRGAMQHSMRIMGKQFVMGRTIEEALKRATDEDHKSYRHSFDMLGEGAKTDEDAERYFSNYSKAIDAIGKSLNGVKDPIASPSISVKLSALHPRYELAQEKDCVPALTKKLLQLARQCAAYGIGLTVDAEEARRLDISLDIIESVARDPALKDWGGFGLAVQAYQKRAFAVIDWLEGLARETDQRLMVRLVKGAYWDSEIKWAQEQGLEGYPVFTRKASTDISYIVCAEKLLRLRGVLYPQFATHNAHTVATIIEMAGADQDGFEFQRLHGMGEPLYHQVVEPSATLNRVYPCRVYAPVGGHEELLSYLVRRLLENGANTSFVNRIQNDAVPVADITADPFDYIERFNDKRHPRIPLPENIFGESRKNSRGYDINDRAVLSRLMPKIENFYGKTWQAAPLIGGVPRIGKTEKAVAPADTSQTIGTVSNATEDDLKLAIDTTHAAYASWSRTSADERAACLERAAELMEENTAELMALCIREGGKTIPDALAELREAVDFCRYYAQRGREDFGSPLPLPGPTGESNALMLESRGVFLCISPWNFPLAIFTGQVTAALMAGNTVIAKPAGQTPLIAMRAVEILHKAGIPQDALALLPASGRMIGEKLVPDERIAGIAFTGSTDTAQTINKTLAARKGQIVPLIAETGGQNAMIVDSSALPEQVVEDVITSAFRSAGQRCSALRVLFVQDSVADKILKMLDGAVHKLVLGNPALLSTDIGPVIDHSARKSLQEHADQMSAQAKLVAQASTNSECERGAFFAPRAFEIKSIDQLTKENFGPILHVIRYRGEDLEDVIDAINSTGFGLTMGLHTRIDHTVRRVAARIRAGNIYVNRSMIGAVVGVQPFGGQGLSGTGPKAGGPHYLHRFATEKTVTVNTTASGGNTTLVSLSEG